MTTYEIVEEALGRLDSAKGEVILDLSPVCRIDSRGLRALENLTATAGAKGVQVALRGVNVDVYKVLKLANLKWHPM